MSITLTEHSHISKYASKEFRHDFYSVDLDGADDYMSIPTLDLNGWTGFTALWRIYWYSDYGETFPYLYDFGANWGTYGYYDIAGSVFQLYLKIAGVTRLVAYAFRPALRWDMYALRWETGDFIRLYRNGVQVGISAATYAGALSATTALPHLLGSNSTTTRSVHGRYAHFALYNRALTLAEIYGLARLSYMRLLQGAVCCLPMEEGLGVTVRDISGNGNHGTLVNGPAWRRNATWELLAESEL